MKSNQEGNWIWINARIPKEKSDQRERSSQPGEQKSPTKNAEASRKQPSQAENQIVSLVFRIRPRNTSLDQILYPIFYQILYLSESSKGKRP